MFHTNPKGDLARIARRLTGTSVGLVLGGGGARGIAHAGVIRALEEAGIPIDIVGGTSMGAIVGMPHSLSRTLSFSLLFAQRLNRG